ncbi:hypothetical protein [Nonomuraea sp. B19D2]|uniref:hypothetical protein n=1 Tax=Nonomuraea sp. B19D2 TaxID=3159561 RepID=UPI0032D9DB19
MTVTRLSPARYPALVELAAARPLADVEVVIKLTYPSLHGQKEFRLRPGVVDADAVELFGFAQSHRLAAAMHERTGWPFALVEQHVNGVWKWAHVGVVTPAGRMLDIHGLREVAEVERQTSDTYGPLARVRQLSTLDDLRDVTAPNPHLADWTADVNGEAGVEIIALLADTLIAKANAESRAESRPVTTTMPAKDAAGHEARALLVAAADERNFRNPYLDRSRSVLCDSYAQTAVYQAQAATANALLAVAGELAELRAEVRQAASVREDLADIADAVRHLAAEIVETSAGQSADLGKQLAELTTAVDHGLADVAREVADVAAAVEEHRGRRSWRSLFRRRRPAEKAPVDAVPEAEPGRDLGVCA